MRSDVKVMSLSFDHDNLVKKINRKINKNFGTNCNCFLCFDLLFKVYRLTFVETPSGTRRTPTNLVNSSLNHLFFNSLNGQTIPENWTENQINIYCLQNLNYFKDRKNFLLTLVDLFITKFGMVETAAINEAHFWQDCLLTVYSPKKNKYMLLLDIGRLDALPETNPLAKMAKGLDIKTNQNNCKYKELEVETDSLENLILLYS